MNHLRNNCFFKEKLIENGAFVAKSRGHTHTNALRPKFLDIFVAAFQSMYYIR